LRQLFARRCPHLDYLDTDDAVVAGWNENLKLVVRYNRWDSNFNVQAESLVSPEAARAAFDELSETIAAIT